MPSTVFTIGYEGAEVLGFLETLEAAGVSHVIDVRDVPSSRKPGFSKTALAAALERVGIGYTHLKPLGDPKPGREAMRSGDHRAFLKIYSRHVAQPAAQASLKEAIAIASKVRSVLLCFEREPKHCHRSLVAGMMQELASFAVRHLTVESDKKKRTKTGGRDGAVVRAAFAIE